MNYIDSIKLIDKGSLIGSILIFLGCISQIKYMIDYNKEILPKEKYPIFIMIQYVWLSFSTYGIIGLGSSNTITYNYLISTHVIIRIVSIIIITLSIFTIIRHWTQYDNKLKQIAFCMILILLMPIGMVVSFCTPLFSLINIPCKYIKHAKLNKG